MIRTVLGVLACVALAGCSPDRSEKPQLPTERERPRRIIEPPSGTVRPLPPHAIRAEGVGPYKLGERVDQLLEQLPSAPRVALFDIPNLAHRSLIRAEDDTVLIGAPEPTGTASFVAVIGAEVARTESGIHVGSTRAEVLKALGAPVDELGRGHDPRCVVPSGLHNLRVVFDGEQDASRVIALVLEHDAGRAALEASGCTRPTVTAGERRTFGACLTGSAAGDVVEVGDDELAIRAAEGERPPLAFKLPNLVFAAPLRNPLDNRDELVAITRIDEPGQRTWYLTSYRIENGRLVRAIEPTIAYQLSAANARWIGVEVTGVDLYLELASRPDAIELSGLMTTRAAKQIRDVVTISTVVIPRRHGKPSEANDAGVPGDASGSDAIVAPPPAADAGAAAGATPPSPNAGGRPGPGSATP